MFLVVVDFLSKNGFMVSCCVLLDMLFIVVRFRKTIIQNPKHVWVVCSYLDTNLFYIFFCIYF